MFQSLKGKQLGCSVKDLKNKGFWNPREGIKGLVEFLGFLVLAWSFLEVFCFFFSKGFLVSREGFLEVAWNDSFSRSRGCFKVSACLGWSWSSCWLETF